MKWKKNLFMTYAVPVNMQIMWLKCIFELRGEKTPHYDTCRQWEHPCESCEYRATSKGHLAKQEKAVHEGILTENVNKRQDEAHAGNENYKVMKAVYTCERCEYQATSEGHLAKHEKAFHEGFLKVNAKAKHMQDLFFW